MEVKEPMSINYDQLKDLVHRTLHGIVKYSPEAVSLLMGTCAQESHLGTYIRQIEGPARGIMQMEPATEQDIWDNYLKFNPVYRGYLKTEAGVFGPDPKVLESNLVYAIAMARTHYLRCPGPIPVTIEGQAAYWKKYYNTVYGAGTEEEYLTNYVRYCTQ
jgi:hypothetical protein